MINWLITTFTEWLMQICYFHSFSNTNIGNPYNVFRLDIFLFLSFNNAQQHGIYLFLKIFLCTKGEVWPRNHLISISADGKYMFDYEIDRVWRFLRVPEPFENCPKFKDATILILPSNFALSLLYSVFFLLVKSCNRSAWCLPKQLISVFHISRVLHEIHETQSNNRWNISGKPRSLKAFWVKYTCQVRRQDFICSGT